MGQFERKIISFEVTVTDIFKQNKHKLSVVKNTEDSMTLWIYDICLHCSKFDIIVKKNSMH